MAATDKGGCYAFFATLRHQKPCEVGITDDDISRVIKYSSTLCKYWLIVAEKEGQDMIDPRMASNFTKRYHCWYNDYNHDDSYHPACRHEIESIAEMLQDEKNDQG